MNHQTQDGETVLMLASQNGHYQVVELLLKEHADVNCQLHDGVIALMLAHHKGHHLVMINQTLKGHLASGVTNNRKTKTKTSNSNLH